VSNPEPLLCCGTVPHLEEWESPDTTVDAGGKIRVEEPIRMVKHQYYRCLECGMRFSQDEIDGKLVWDKQLNEWKRND
jgi:hypothetical protein